MSSQAFTVFETAIGPCGIAWGERGVIGVQLPEGRASATRARLRQRFPQARESAPPEPIERAMQAIVELLRGERIDLSAIVLDMADVSPFHRRVYEAARTISPGETLSYGGIATRIGSPNSARAVGQALRRNPFAIVVPCHRVLAAGGKSGGFTANGGVDTKLRMLAIEQSRHATEAAPQTTSADAGLGFDPQAAVDHLRSADGALAKLIDKVGPCRMEIKQTTTLFGALAEAIVYQQLTGKAAATIFGRVCALYPKATAGPTPKDILRTPDEKLRGAGLSTAKTAALRDLAQKTADREIPTIDEARGLSDDELIERLTKVRGIGRWTVEMLLMFRLGRPDILPVDDYGVRKGFALAFKKPELPSRQDLEKRGARWKPYRSAASWYLWRAVDLAKQA